MRAQEHFLPSLWRADANTDKALQPDSLAVPWGPQSAAAAPFHTNGGLARAGRIVYSVDSWTLFSGRASLLTLCSSQ